MLDGNVGRYSFCPPVLCTSNFDPATHCHTADYKTIGYPRNRAHIATLGTATLQCCLKLWRFLVPELRMPAEAGGGNIESPSNALRTDLLTNDIISATTTPHHAVHEREHLFFLSNRRSTHHDTTTRSKDRHGPTVVHNDDDDNNNQTTRTRTTRTTTHTYILSHYLLQCTIFVWYCEVQQ